MKRKEEVKVDTEDIPFRGMLPIMVLSIMADGEKHHVQGLVNKINKKVGFELAKRTSIKDIISRLGGHGDIRFHSEESGPVTVYYQITEKGIETAERRIEQAREVKRIMYQFYKLFDKNTKNFG